MIKLAQTMASVCEADRNLDLALLVAHYIDEVEVNVQSDAFDHLGFVESIRDALATEARRAGDDRGGDYLRAVVDALQAYAASLSSVREAEPSRSEQAI
jgi:hypothetical protein